MMTRPGNCELDPPGHAAPQLPSALSAQRGPKLMFSDSDSESESDGTKSEASRAESPGSGGGARLNINREYARRFEHNKKREELQRLARKYSKDGYQEESDSSDSEDEDDTAVLATERLDHEIAETIEAIRKKDPKIYDGKTTFFSLLDEEEDAETSDTDVEEKPMFLKDYHRQNLLAEVTGEEKCEGTPTTFVQEQEDLKRTVVSEMHQAAEQSEEDGDDGGNGFLVRKSAPDEPASVDDVPDPATADPNKPEEYLTRFLSSRAWTKPTAFTTLEDEDEEDEERMEKFEQTYNFRFEDPDAGARGKLVTYGRDIVSANTARREKKSTRKREREKRLEQKAQEKELREREKGRLGKLKTEELMRKFKMIREAAGLDDGNDEAVEAEMLEKLLEGDWSDEQWGEWMASRFGDGYYEAESGKIKKPKFGDDIDITDIVSDSGFENIDGNEAMEVGEGLGGDWGGSGGGPPARRGHKDKKTIQKEERVRKQKDRALKRKLGQYVEDTFDFEDQLPAKADRSSFRYRQTTPESYGLTPLEILAAEDADLNSFVGIKKLAPFREPEKKKKDKKLFGKKKRLREWRKETFGDEEGIKLPAGWKPGGETTTTRLNADSKVEEGGKGRRKRRRKGGNAGKG